MASTTDLVNFFGWLTIALPTQQASRIAIGGDGGLGFGGMARDFSRFERIFFYGYPEKNIYLAKMYFCRARLYCILVMSWFSGKAYRDRLCLMERTPEVSSQISMEIPSFIFAFH